MVPVPPRRCPLTGDEISPSPGCAACALCGLRLEGARDAGLWWCGSPRLEAEAPTATGSLDGSGPQAPEHLPLVPGLRLIAVLGIGGGGTVYEAAPEADPTARLALKVMGGQDWASPTQIARFRREVSLTVSLDDPGLVRILDSGTTAGGQPWYTMPVMRGTSLFALAKGTLPSPPWTEIARIVSEVARTLNRLHQRGVVHRDIKPGNILLDPKGRALISDLGLALPQDQTRLTLQGRALGTPAYMAPEQLSGEVGDWRPVDTFALGRVLQDLLKGQAPLRPGDTLQVPPPRALRWIADSATAHRTRDRPERIGVLADWLEDWQARPQQGPPAAAVAAFAGKEARRPGTRLAALGGALAVAGGLTVFLLWSALQERSEVQARWSIAQDRAQRAQSAGAPEEAMAILSQFAWEKEVADSPERSLAHLELAALAQGAGDLEGGLSEALLAATTAQAVPQRRRALDVLLRQAQDSADPELVARILLLHDDLGWEALPPEDPIRRWSAISRLDLDHPSLTSEDRALLAPFTGAVPTDWPGEVGRIPWTQSTEEMVVVSSKVEAPTRRAGSWQVPEGWHLLLGAALGPGLVQDPEWRLWSLSPEGPRPVQAPPGGLAAAARVQGRLFVAEGGPAARVWEVNESEAKPALKALNTREWFALGMRAVDWSGRKDAALLLTLGPPAGFMTVLVEPGPEGLEVLASGRSSYGYPIGVLPAREGVPARTVVTRLNAHPAPEVFGDAEPYGGRCGLVVHAVQGAQMEEVQELSFRRPTELCPHGQGDTVDLDGDGQLEVLLHINYDDANLQPATLIYRQRPDGSLSKPWLLEGIQVLGTSEDGGMLLGLYPGDGTRSAWKSQAGGPGLPLTPIPERRAREAPCAPHHLALGLNTSAAEICERSLEEDPALRRLQLLTAAQAWLAAGQPERARQAAERAEVLPGPQHPVRKQAWLAAARDAPFRFGGVQDPEQRALLEEELNWLDGFGAPSLHLLANASLPPAVQLPVPEAVTHGLLQGRLELQAPGGAGPVLVIPLEATGTPTGVHLRGQVDRAEWASKLHITLRRVGETGVGVTYAGKGGGERSYVASEGLCTHQAETKGLQTPLDLEVDLWWTSDGEALRCRSTLDGQTTLLTGAAPPRPEAGEAWELVIAAAPPYFGIAGQTVVLNLEALSLWGMRPRSGVLPPPKPWMSWALGRGPMPKGAPDPAALIAALRLEASVGERIREGLGEQQARELEAQAWLTNAQTHLDAPLFREVWSTLALPEDLDPEALRSFEIARGSALAAKGELNAAEESFYELAGSEQIAWNTRLEAQIRLAEIALSQGDEAKALDLIRGATDQAPDTDLARRLVRHRPRFQALRAKAAWSFLWGSLPPVAAD